MKKKIKTIHDYFAEVGKLVDKWQDIPEASKAQILLSTGFNIIARSELNSGQVISLIGHCMEEGTQTKETVDDN